jgi:peptide/nickel transport system permease protein
MSRSETLKESVSNYVIAAENINIPWYRILIRHIWPNIKSTLLVTAIFTFSASILLEASLSFIGLGMRLEEVTWGSLMNEGRNYLPGWWLSLFPGLAIFSLLFALNWLFIKQKNFDSIEEKSTI